MAKRRRKTLTITFEPIGPATRGQHLIEACAHQPRRICRYGTGRTESTAITDALAGLTDALIEALE